MVFENAKKIWNCDVYVEDEYAEFLQSINFDGEKTFIRLSACGDYTLYVNGKFASSGQYGDFPHYKVYDEIDITEYLEKGENTVAILVWYFGVTTMRHFTPTPGLIYEITCGDKIIASSCENTLSRKSLAYVSGRCKKLTPQLGNSFTYNMNLEDNWRSGDTSGFTESAVFEKEKEYFARPIEKHILEDAVPAKIYTTEKGTYMAELPEEIVGLVAVSFLSDSVQNVNIAYGELLENGHVKRHIDTFRDFSFDLIAREGENNFSNHMLRFACKYMEIECEKPLSDIRLSLIPQVYPVKEKEYSYLKGLDSDIYKICLNTLNLCMMEHYVDCPWREQCLYGFDSRNQMLAGYYAYADGNYEYARSNLLLMSKDRRPDGLLTICAPSARDMAIPSFALWYIVAINEYMDHSGDLSLGTEVFEKITDVLKTFTNYMEDGLFVKVSTEGVWHFYDWSPYAEFERTNIPHGPDALLNIIAIIAFNAYEKICEKLGKENVYSGLSKSVGERVNKEYFDEEKGLYFFTKKGEYTDLINSLAIYSGIVDEAKMKDIAKALCSNTLIPSSLSYKTFKFDAVISCGKENIPYVFGEIRRIYKNMLDAGSTTVWETELGAVDFENAGSLCHGWSSMPVYYYNKYKDQL